MTGYNMNKARGEAWSSIRWDEEREKTLTRLVSEGDSAGLIAQKMRLTRNSVIGKVKRLGLQLKGNVGIGHSLPNPRHKAKTVVVRGVEKKARWTDPGVAKISLSDYERDAPRVDIFSLRTGVCRWPLFDNPKDPGARYCGHQASWGRKYCKVHTHRSIDWSKVKS